LRDAAAARAEAGVRDPFAPVRPSLDAVEAYIERGLSESGLALGEMGKHLLLSGGKRLRPALVLLCGGLFGGDTERMVPVAAACEIIHMATLVHDDLIDCSEVRRGVPSVHAKWGAPASVLVGDHLFAKGFSILAAQGDPAIVRLMSDVVSRTCAGEIEQLRSLWRLDITEATYLERVYAKTGYFIEECCRMGALLGRASPSQTAAVAGYGAEVGTCFQLVDDLLDLTASERVLGKPTGSDLRTGVFTLPVVWALSGPYGGDLRALLERRPFGDEQVRAVREVLRVSGALDYAARAALAMARRAQGNLEGLPGSVHRDVLYALAEDLAHRVA
jgi:heptaprenyl diphosphate synthase